MQRLLALALTGLACHSFGLTETRKVSDFQRIEAGDIYQIQYKAGAAPSFVVEGEDAYVRATEVKQRGGTLSIRLRNPELLPKSRRRITVRVTSNQLMGTRLSGTASLSTQGVKAKRFEASLTGSSSLVAVGTFGGLDLNLSGSSQATVDGLNADGIRVSLDGSSGAQLRGSARGARIDLGGSSSLIGLRLTGGEARCVLAGTSRIRGVTGDASRLTVTASGASDFNGAKLTAARAWLTAEGASQITARASQDLKADASGASSISVAGNPRNLSRRTSGSAEISVSN